jgi:methylated-DNA-[protein]-cysteine S-methyltransferase
MIFTTFCKSPLGLIEVSGTQHAVTSVMFVEAQKKPSPHLEPTETISEVMKECLIQLDEYFAGQRQEFDVITDQSGTFFQKKVWKELLNVPYGKKMTYLQLARKLGDEKSIRAVASANGENKLNIIVPCHRIIGTDGSLTGYGGDLWRKRWLLDYEEEKTIGKWTLF